MQHGHFLKVSIEVSIARREVMSTKNASGIIECLRLRGGGISRKKGGEWARGKKGRERNCAPSEGESKQL